MLPSTASSAGYPTYTSRLGCSAARTIRRAATSGWNTLPTGRGFDGIFVGHVGGNRQGRAARSLHVVFRALQPVVAAREQRDPRPEPRELDCRGAADARRGSCQDYA